jgi:hypothetical protein
MTKSTKPLAAQCAAHPAWIWYDGMLCHDDASDSDWRLNRGVWAGTGAATGLRVTLIPLPNGSDPAFAAQQALDRAKAAGPVESDPATMGALAVACGMDIFAMEGGYAAQLLPGPHGFLRRKSMPEAILAAWLAAHQGRRGRDE